MTNRISIIGNLTKNPELKYIGERNLAICNFTIAHNFKENNQDKVNFHNVQCFGKTAEFVAETQKKGFKVLVFGRIIIDQFKNKNGHLVNQSRITSNEIITFNKNLKNNNNVVLDEIPDSEVPF